MIKTKKFQFGTRSEANLLGVDPALVRVIRRALEISACDVAVIEGCRTIERQRELYAQGRTAPGSIVTWTMDSKHIPSGTPPLGKAVDVLPINPQTGKADWSYAPGFIEFARAMAQASEELGIAIRWGADWNQNGRPHEKGETDSPHFEKVG